MGCASSKVIHERAMNAWRKARLLSSYSGIFSTMTSGLEVSESQFQSVERPLCQWSTGFDAIRRARVAVDERKIRTFDKEA